MNPSHKNSNPPTTIQIPNYQIIETVYSGSRTLVYRAIRTSDQLPVVIKLLKNEYPNFTNWYSFAISIRLPKILTYLDRSTLQSRTVLQWLCVSNGRLWRYFTSRITETKTRLSSVSF